MSFTPEQAKNVKDSIAAVEKSIVDYEAEITRMRRAGLASAAQEGQLKAAKDALAKIKAVYG
jgi:hypothetical protein